jgi:hypothetical protein
MAKGWSGARDRLKSLKQAKETTEPRRIRCAQLAQKARESKKNSLLALSGGRHRRATVIKHRHFNSKTRATRLVFFDQQTPAKLANEARYQPESQALSRPIENKILR